MRRYLDVATVAERYGVSEWTVYDWTRQARIPHRKVGGRVLFLEAELDAHDDGAPLTVKKVPRGRGRVVMAVAPTAAADRSARGTRA